MEKVLSDLEKSSSSSDEIIAEVSYYTSESESESKFETLEYYDNSTNYGYKKAKVKDYEYYKTKMLPTKKDKDKQVLLAEDHAWMESSSDSDQDVNANMVFM
nr:hypothetical protein [Tanacetum cinerariifolium]